MNNVLSVKKPGFTLLETLVALFILAIVLGGSITAVRALSRQTRLSSEQAEMSQLADETIANLRTVRDTAHDGSATATFAAKLGFPGSGLQKVTGALILNSALSASANYQQIGWCTKASGCGGVISPVSSPTKCGALTCTLNAQYSAFGGELVAVSRSDGTSACPATSANLLSIPSVTACGINTESATNDWSYYIRTVTVSRATPTATQFQVTVSLKSFTDPGSKLQRQIFLSDYDPSLSPL